MSSFLIKTGCSKRTVEAIKRNILSIISVINVKESKENVFDLFENIQVHAKKRKESLTEMKFAEK